MKRQNKEEVEKEKPGALALGFSFAYVSAMRVIFATSTLP